jgi:hypothetical protein
MAKEQISVHCLKGHVSVYNSERKLKVGAGDMRNWKCPHCGSDYYRRVIEVARGESEANDGTKTGRPMAGRTDEPSSPPTNANSEEWKFVLIALLIVVVLIQTFMIAAMVNVPVRMVG